MKKLMLAVLVLFATVLAPSAHAYITFDANHKAAWELEDSSGTDATGNGHTITIAGGTTVTGIQNLGRNGFTATIANHADFNSGSFTIELWYNASDASGSRVLVNKPQNAPPTDSAPQYAIVAGAGVWCVGLPTGFEFSIQSAGGGMSCAIAPMTIQTNKWYYIVAEYDGTNMRLYVDGVLKNTTATTYQTHNNELCLGKRCQGDLVMGAQSLDEVYYSNINRSAAYIANVYASYLNKPPVINITAPANLSTIDYQRLFNFTPTDDTTTSMKCWNILDGVTTFLGNVTNNTASTGTLVTSHGFHNYTVTCEDNNGVNGTASTYFTTLHYNVTNILYSTPVAETSNASYAVVVAVAGNIADLNATMTYNNTVLNVTKVSNTTLYTFNMTRIPDLVPANNTEYSFNWFVTIGYTNGSYGNFTTATNKQNVTLAYFFNGLTGNGTRVVTGQTFNLTGNATYLLPLLNGDRTVTLAMNITMNMTGALQTNTTVLFTNTSTTSLFTQFYTGVNISEVFRPVVYNATLYVSYNGITRSIFAGQYSFIIDNIIFTSCTSGLYALNFTFANERDLAMITSGRSLQMQLDVWDTSGSYNRTFGYSMDETTGFAICITPNYTTSVKANATIIFSATGYYQRNYYLVNASLTNQTTIVNLYLLNSTIDGQLRVLAESQLGLPAPGKFVRIERYYPQNATIGAYKIVAMILSSDPAGDGYTFVEYDTATYRFTVLDGNTILREFSNRQIQKTSITDVYASIILRLSEGVGDYFNYIKGTLVATSCTANNNTGIVSCTIQDTSGLTISSTMVVSKKTTNTTYSAVCTQTITGSAGGTMLCNVSSSGAGIYKYALTVTTASRTYPDKTGIFTISMPPTFSQDGLLIAAMMFMLAVMAGIYISVEVSMILGSVSLGLVFWSMGMYDALFGFIITVVVIAGIFIIWGQRHQ